MSGKQFPTASSYYWPTGYNVEPPGYDENRWPLPDGSVFTPRSDQEAFEMRIAHLSFPFQLALLRHEDPTSYLAAATRLYDLERWKKSPIWDLDLASEWYRLQRFLCLPYMIPGVLEPVSEEPKKGKGFAL